MDRLLELKINFHRFFNNKKKLSQLIKLFVRENLERFSITKSVQCVSVLIVYGHGSYRKEMYIQKSICALTRSINNKSCACTVSYSPLNFCARVESVDDILLIASRVTLSMVVFEL